ncbi:MAG: CHASE3 domain-containing protein, partial [Actinomycetota bacterium]|nr:CHASE3 domain-containing protein [Actinomycetota bacterium]
MTLPVVVMLLGLAVLAVSERQLRSAEESVTHTHEVRTEIFRLAIVVRDTDAAVAAGLLTGDPRLLGSIDAARPAVSERLQRLRALVHDMDEQVGRVDRLEPLLKERLNVLGEAARLRTSTEGGPPQVPPELLRRTAELEGQIRPLLDEMEAVELRLLEQRTERAEATRHRQLMAGLLAGLGGVAGAVAAVVMFSRGVVRAVRRVEDTACRIEQRAELPPLGSAGEDEVGRLERTLRSTAARLADQEEAARRETLWLASFVAVQQAVIGSTEIEEASSRASAAAVELLGGAGCTVELIEGGELVCCTASGELADQVGRRTPLTDSPAAPVVESGELVRLESETTRGRPALVAPLQHDGHVLGAFTVTAGLDRSLSPRDANALELLA